MERLEHGARLLADAGIDRSVGFVLGLPGEDDSSVEASIHLALRVKPERLQFTRWTPLPGSALGDASMEPGRTFHVGGNGRVEGWVRHAYERCGGQGWGAESW